MSKSNELNLSDRLYWFFRNFLSIMLHLLFMPIKIIFSILVMLKVLCNTSGSEVISWPWEDFQEYGEI